MSSFEFKHGSYSSPEGESQGLENNDVEAPFEYLFPDLVSDPDAVLPEDDPEAIIEALKALGAAMVMEPTDDRDHNSKIPPIYTYWGQFIDHDITRIATNPDSLPDIFDTFTPPHEITILRSIHNERRPFFDLDSVYGDGPNADDQAKNLYTEDLHFKLGKNAPHSDPIPHPHLDVDSAGNPTKAMRDLPREAKRALIVDARNDENTIISQFHLSFLKFHNKVLDSLHEKEGLEGKVLFERARRVTQHHYQ